MGLKLNISKLRNAPLHWKMLIGGQIIITAVLTATRFKTAKENDPVERMKVQSGASTVKPPSATR